MVRLEKIGMPYGIPVYFQRLPDLIRSVSMKLVVFTGSADDLSVGLPGLYHWFEHVPFRGTKGFTKEQIWECERRGSKFNAHTTKHYTAFECHAPISFWRQGLNVVTDLVGQPLLTRESILAEREIIQQEINQALSSASSFAGYHVGNLIYPNHPLGHYPLGTPASLSATNPDILHLAHEKGYARNRCVLLMAGNIEEDDVLKEAEACLEKIPDHPLTERRKPISYGPTPDWRTDRVVIDTDFASSVVSISFPIPPPGENAFREYCAWDMLDETFSSGGLQSPLMKIVREERKLVYSAGSSIEISPDGGGWGMGALTSSDKIEPVLQAFKDVLTSEQAASERWNKYVKEACSTSHDMQPIASTNYTKNALRSLVEFGEVRSEEEVIQQHISIPHQDTLKLIQSLHWDRGRVIIFRGRGRRKWPRSFRDVLRLLPWRKQ